MPHAISFKKGAPTGLKLRYVFSLTFFYFHRLTALTRTDLVYSLIWVCHRQLDDKYRNPNRLVWKDMNPTQPIYICTMVCIGIKFNMGHNIALVVSGIRKRFMTWSLRFKVLINCLICFYPSVPVDLHGTRPLGNFSYLSQFVSSAALCFVSFALLAPAQSDML